MNSNRSLVGLVVEIAKKAKIWTHPCTRLSKRLNLCSVLYARANNFLKEKNQLCFEGKVKPKTLCPWETGKQLLSLPESELLSRLQADGLPEKQAKEFYLSLWKLFIDARTKQRDSKLKAKAKKRDPDMMIDPNFNNIEGEI